MKSIMKFSAAFEKKHGGCFLVARMVDIIEVMILYDLLTWKGSWTEQSNTKVAKFLFQNAINLNIVEDTYRERGGSQNAGISHLNDGNLLFS